MRPKTFLRSAGRVLGLVVLLVALAGLWATQPVRARPRRSAAGANPARLQARVKVLAVDFAPRSAGHSENLARCADYIHQHFEAAGAVVDRQPYDVGGRRFENVTARFGPADGPRVVVGAHYDAFGPFPAADDNASGVAGLLELARLLGAGPVPACGVELVAYCTEEPPYFTTPAMGSHVHARVLQAQGVPVRAMLALEMIGFFRDAPWSQAYPVGALYAVYPIRGNYIAVIGRVPDRPLIARVKRAMKGAGDLPVWSASLPPNVPGVDLSDHRNYWAQGCDAVMITDTAFYRNRAYHTARDTWDTLDYARMAQVVTGVYEAVLDLAGVKEATP